MIDGCHEIHPGRTSRAAAPTRATWRPNGVVVGDWPRGLPSLGDRASSPLERGHDTFERWSAARNQLSRANPLSSVPVGVGVVVPVGIGVPVAVSVDAGVPESSGADGSNGDSVGVDVGVSNSESVGVGVDVSDGVGVGVGVDVGVGVSNGESVAVGVSEGVGVGVSNGESVGVGVGVSNSDSVGVGVSGAVGTSVGDSDGDGVRVAGMFVTSGVAVAVAFAAPGPSLPPMPPPTRANAIPETNRATPAPARTTWRVSRAWSGPDPSVGDRSLG